MFAALLLLLVSSRAAGQFGGALTIDAAATSGSSSLDRTQQALEIAKMAAEHEMQELSLRAVRQTLVNGPPLASIVVENDPFGRSTANADVNSQIEQETYQRLAELSELWRRKGVDAQAVAETLAEVVMPAKRPGEVFFYAPPVSPARPTPYAAGSLISPQSVAQLAVEWAARGSALDNLRKRAQERAEQPRGRIAAMTLLAMLEQHAGDDDRAAERLGALADALRDHPGEHVAELAAHAAMPALRKPATAQAALPLVERLVERLTAPATGNPRNAQGVGEVLLTLARLHFDAGDAEAGKKRLQAHLDVLQQNNIRYSGDYGLVMRKSQLERAAVELARAGLVEDALNRLGESADITVANPRSTSHAVFLAALCRRLVQMPPAEQYALLRAWSLPTANRRSVRRIMGYAPAHRPPPRFAVATLGGQTSGGQAAGFDLPAIGPAGAWLDTGAALIDAAVASGQIAALAAELEPLAEEKIEQAQPLWLLAAIAAGRSQELAPQLAELAARMEKELPAPNDRSKPIDLSHVALALVCAEAPPLRDIGRQMLETLVTHTQRVQDAVLRPQLNYALALAQARQTQGLEADPAAALAGLGSPFWQAASHSRSAAATNGGTPSVWAAQEGHFRHLSGPGEDFLYFRWPLAGSFDLLAEVLDDGWSEGSLAYGGLVFDSTAHNKTSILWTPGGHGQTSVACPSLVRGKMNEHRLEVRPERVRLWINRHLVFEDRSPSAASPWLALYTHSGRTPYFRNLRIRGEVEIPREARLSDDPQMRGWMASMLGETRPAIDLGAPSSSQPTTTTMFDWRWSDGEILGRRTSPGVDGPAESALAYHRPLFDGESVSYEFYYDPHEHQVHPAIGRVAFLIGPEGVRLHWIAGAEGLWTGLSTGHAIAASDEEADVAGVPLKSDQWNAASLSLRDGIVAVAVNDKEVCRYPIEAGDSPLFGLFRFKDQSAARVRNVVLRGDWPEAWDDHSFARLTEASPDSPEALRRLRQTLIGEPRIATEALEVIDRALAEPLAARYGLLASWVLPGPGHSELRLYGDFTPAHPDPAAPLRRADQEQREAALAMPQPRRIEIGGNLAAPAIELVHAAQELGRLDELRAKAEALRQEPENERAAVALLAMIDLAGDRPQEAAERLEELLKLTQASGAFDLPAHWPEMTAAAFAMRHEAVRPAVIRLLDWMVVEQIQKLGPSTTPISTQVRRLRGVAHYLAEPESRQRPFGAPLSGPLWHSTTHPTAASRGRGDGPSHWREQEGEWRHSPGHENDYLYLGIPITGDYEIDCELPLFGWRDTHLLTAGHWNGIRYTKTEFDMGAFGKLLPRGKIDPPLDISGSWYRYQIKVKGATETAFVNGRLLHERTRSATPDPWIAIHTTALNSGGVRKLAIRGDYQIPSELRLSAGGDLSSWLAHYYGETTDGDNADWRKEGEAIVGRKRAFGQAKVRESVLQYHRPLFEDGEIEYEFRYSPGQEMAHPTLDRLTLLIHPQGVKVHWLTDAEHARGGLAPDNEFDEPDIRRGDGAPLKENDWNQAKVAVAGDTLSLWINGQLVAERQIEPTNLRIFGLYHNAVEEEAKVRNVVYRGQWPTTLPSGNRQSP